MKKATTFVLLSFLIIIVFFSCGEDDEYISIVDPLPVSEVHVDLQNVPYPKLSDYNFFEGSISELNARFDVIPYQPISSLFSDYAHKKRFLWMPHGVKASYVSDGKALNFPTNAVLIKSFYYNNVQPSGDTKIMETRLMIKKDEGWVFAEYIWNDEQTDAFLDVNGDGDNIPIEWIEGGVSRSLFYHIPAQSECFTCHKDENATFAISPIGLKPQSLNSDFIYENGTVNQLQKLIDVGYLEDNLPSIVSSVIDYNDTSKPLDLRARSYFDINCASCHSDGGHCNYRRFRFAFNLTENDDGNLGICVVPDDLNVPNYQNSKLVDPGNPENSMLLFRISTNQEQYRMPLLGRRIVHEEGVLLIDEWITSLNQICN
ncbi:hypothetical protein ULMS_04230 [Patiriisocius marinistellae]|uniref:Uncharacterized protein n=1 Tax=Patiriisocius marinistellae TaxID=2494560 RepID=A0A5J4FXZ4_9FLAO|nr:hypothetical protein [Patiriisocius marinistellae]GEQ84915.1 hypothetical protein ULMS_04230 [Patiriisocius marinistellae]